MGFSTDECAWKKVSIKMLGRTLVGISGFEFEKNFDKEYLYGAGDEPIDIQDGNKSYPGSFKLYKYEIDLLNDAAQAAGFADITEVPHELIVATCVFKKTLTSKTRTITSSGIAFSNLKAGMEQGAKKTEMTLPFIAMNNTFA